MDAKQLRETATRLFEKRTQFMLLCQEIAENFYPERADFTLRREIGEEWAGNLMTSFPLQCRRDLGDQIGTMLRPTAKGWFHMQPQDNMREDNDAKRWLEWAGGVQRRAMYDRVTKFTRATKEGDHDFAAFGQAVLSARLNRQADALLYRCWHIRDVVWLENEEGEISFVARKWKPTVRDLKRLFGSKVHNKILRKPDRQQLDEVECLHMVVEADMFDGNAQGKPYFSIYYDCENDHVMEALPVYNREYIIPRWQTVSGSQYAYSPATVAALPDARLIQAMTYTLLEAGEKATNPPLIATHDAVRSDMAVYAGGVTWVDLEYDERLGEAIRPMPIDMTGIPLGIDMQRDTREMLARAFFLNKLRPFLPTEDKEMTAYQAGQIVAQYIRDAMPLFEPMELEYNGALCEVTFDILLRAGTFGSPFDMPRSLQGADIQFRFESPLHDAIEQQKGQKFLEMNQLLAQAVEMNQSVLAVPDIKVAFRDALSGIQVPSRWVRSETTVQQIEDAQRAAQESAQMLAAMEQGSTVAKNLAGASKDMAQAQVA